MQRLFVPLLLTLILVGFIVGGLYERQSRIEIEASLKGDLEGLPLRQQAGAERVFQEEQSFYPVLTLASNDQMALYGPLRVKEGPDDEIFVLDSGDVSLKRFSAEGKFLTRYGLGKGQGPGEFTGLSDFSVTESGEVWTVDPNNGRITVFTTEGQVARTIRLAQPPYRLSLTSSSTYFVTFMLIRDRVFGRFVEPQQLTREFGTFLNQQGRNAMLLDGWMVPDGRDGFIYAALYAGLLAGYDAQGRPRFFSELLGRPELPKILGDDKGRRWVDQEAPGAAAGVSVSPNGIHVIGLWKTGLKTKGSIDTYSLTDGSYQNSMKLPEPCHSALMTDRHLYTVLESKVSKWRLGP